MTSRTELFDWYLAYLRKSALSHSAAQAFTPLALVKADAEMIKELIENDLGRLEKKSSAEISTSSRNGDDLSASVNHALNRRIVNSRIRIVVLFVSIFLSAWCLYLLHSEPFTAADSAARVSIRLTIDFCLALNILVSLLSVIYAKSSSDNHEKRELTMPLVSESGVKWPGDADAIISDLSKQIEILQQKEMLIFDFSPHLLCRLSADGTVAELNAFAKRLIHPEIGDAIGKSIFEFLNNESKSKLKNSLARCKTNHDFEEVELSLKDGAGSEIDFRWRSEWSSSAEAFFCMAEDISARKEVERLKNEMSTMINHDLRSPIGALALWVDNMLSGVHGALPERTVASLKRTFENLKGVLDLLDCLLDAEKLESNSLKCNANAIDIQESFDNAKQLFQELCDTRKVKLTIEETTIFASGDSLQVNRIMNNFCSNAINWSPVGGAVCLRARQEADFAVIEVEDCGPGIPENIRESLFQRWANSVDQQRQSPSSGLGLYISRKFAELQGGTVGVKNREGGGSIFWFSLPLPPER